MRNKNQYYTNFSRTIHTYSDTWRPAQIEELDALFAQSIDVPLLARGRGLSYSDCCVLNHGQIIDTSRLNHILSFDKATGIAVCQPAVTFADLFLLDAHYIPPVLPGTLHATLAGGVAHDVHGKNNHHAGSFGHHIEWLELHRGTDIVRCSRQENTHLFHATIAGLGLTGVITCIAVRLRRASHFVKQHTERFTCLAHLLHAMQHKGIHADYQVAWLDLLNQPRAILKLADHVEKMDGHLTRKIVNLTIPPVPFRLIHTSLMKQFNRAYFNRGNSNPSTMPLTLFNHPLDKIQHWNRLYGKKGFIQFQAVFAAEHAHEILQQLLACIKKNQATATLVVLKYFTQPGIGLLSFVQPGFTLAVDFIHNQRAVQTILALNQIICDVKGNVYLAKDLHLTPEQFRNLYPQHETFRHVLSQHKNPLCSDLAQRLGLNLPFTAELGARQKIECSKLVVPANTGSNILSRSKWIPAFAGKTNLLLSCTKKHLQQTQTWRNVFDVKKANQQTMLTQRTWVILGATSIIAEEFAHLAAQLGHSLLLVARNPSQLLKISADIKLRYSIHCDIMRVDLEQDIHLLLHRLNQSTTEFDLFIAYSQMLDNPQLTPFSIQTMITTNITSTAQIIHAYWQKTQRQHRILFLSSVAACRGRAKNSLYGASKVAIEFYLQGLQQASTSTQHITIARLGYIDTLNTYGKPGIFYASPPKSCAKACLRGIQNHKKIVYHPFFWSMMMTTIRHLPWSIYRRMQKI